MSTKPQVLLVGDQTDAPWHPLEPAQRQLESILGQEYEVVGTEDYDSFARLGQENQLEAYRFCLSYTDCWNRSLTREQTAGILRYVAGGGGLLVIHNGVSLHNNYELLQVIGAKFTGHPPYQSLTYSASIADHPLLEGVESFTVDEEPYMFEFDLFTKKTVFLEYEYEGGKYPAAWESTYGLGKVVYLQPGHHAPSFEPASYRRLVLNSARYVAERL
ncbi:glycosyl hydrolase [Paenibacillus ferrarius]|uniref:Glycosyl hydrolase n=1 Tax=Paenibacillus ferrarius TaxID=1469647 RepID=A0A1V4HMV7_9BACL|nr:ThuA domain-containing protein [Paenibacillus ferrarius]OPH58986.1 glycosyl hydrolase [Paenibacillus ferrarius]